MNPQCAGIAGFENPLKSVQKYFHRPIHSPPKGGGDYFEQPLRDLRGISGLNALTNVGALRIVIDFTLSNARRFYSSVGNPLAVKGSTKTH